MLPDFRPTSPSFFDELFTILPGICFNKEEMSGIFYERLNGSSVFFFSDGFENRSGNTRPTANKKKKECVLVHDQCLI